MKKGSRVLFCLTLMLSLLVFPYKTIAAGGFKKYEDFEKEFIGVFSGNDKFSVDESCVGDGVADVSIESYNGSQQVKFTYNGIPDNPCNLEFKQCPERIVGIKADVTVASCAAGQNCRAGLLWHRGITSTDYLYAFESVQLRPNQYGDNSGDISTAVSLLDHTNDFAYEGDAYSASFNSPIPMLGETFTVTAYFNKPYQVSVTVWDEGTISYTVSKKDALISPVELFKAIGILVVDDAVNNGQFVAYFDNIYIKTKGGCDKRKPSAKAISPKKNLPIPACSLDIKFSEPMDTCCWNVETDPLWGAVTDTEWSADRKTFRFWRECSTLLSTETRLNFVVNPVGSEGEDIFLDLAGNPAKRAKLSTKTMP